MATFVCEQCGKVEDIAPSLIRCGRRYCSKECKAASARTRPTPGRVEMACLQCGGTFLVPRSWAREGRRKFCGRTCQRRYLKTLTGEKSPRYGKAHTSESRDKMSRTRMERGSAQKGPDHPAWKGGRLSAKAYTEIMIDYLPEDQRAMARLMRPQQSYIAEHRLVMAMTLGRPLAPKEVVHHKNGVKNDNRPENLTLMDWGKHSQKHRHLERQYAVLLAENEALKVENARLKSLLKTCRENGSTTLS